MSHHHATTIDRATLSAAAIDLFYLLALVSEAAFELRQMHSGC